MWLVVVRLICIVVVIELFRWIIICLRLIFGLFVLNLKLMILKFFGGINLWDGFILNFVGRCLFI